MPDATLESVLASCELLSARCDRIQRWGVVFVVLSALAGGLVGALAGTRPTQTVEEGSPDLLPDSVRAKRFEVIGRDGSVVGVLGVDRDGRPLLELRSADGATDGGIVRMGFESGPEISLSDEHQIKRMWACIRPELGIGVGIPSGIPRTGSKVPILQLLNEDGGPALELRAPLHGPGQVVVHSHDGTVVCTVPE